MPNREELRRAPSGLPVDPSGGPTIDPTKNVLDLVSAETRRHDDLRYAEGRRQDELRVAERRHTAEIALVRDACANEKALMREQFAREMTAAESRRLDAIRQVDQNNMSNSSNQAQIAIKAVADTMTQTFNTIIARVAALERTSYSGEGKSAGLSTSWGVVLGLVTLISTLLGIGSVLFMYFGSK